jgi:hypothetical protein
MTRHVNHRGWIVRHSIGSDDGHLCVDFFEDTQGDFGFELFRADPEDGGRWQSLSLYGATRYQRLADTVVRAGEEIDWVSSQPRASASFDLWRQEVGVASQ